MNNTCKRDVEVLEDIYKNEKMGSDSILKVMPKASNEKFRAALTCQLSGYERFSEKAREMLSERGYKAKEENPMTKLWASNGVAMNTMVDSSDSHLAQMVVEGSTMGVTDTLKLLRESENSGVTEKTLKMMRDIISFEEKNVEIMKGFI